MAGPEWIVLGVLAVWRVTSLLQAEDGPWDLSARLRRVAGAGHLGRLLDCFYCLSLWVAIPIVFLIEYGWRGRILLWLGLSGGAILLQRLIAPAAPFMEHSIKDETHELLRKNEAGIHGGDEHCGG